MASKALIYIWQLQFARSCLVSCDSYFIQPGPWTDNVQRNHSAWCNDLHHIHPRFPYRTSTVTKLDVRNIHHGACHFTAPSKDPSVPRITRIYNYITLLMYLQVRWHTWKPSRRSRSNRSRNSWRRNRVFMAPAVAICRPPLRWPSRTLWCWKRRSPARETAKPWRKKNRWVMDWMESGYFNVVSVMNRYEQDGFSATRFNKNASEETLNCCYGFLLISYPYAIAL